MKTKNKKVLRTLLRRNLVNVQGGFTLIELLVGAAILGTISIVGVQLLWDSLTTRSKQVSIEGSSDNLRPFLTTLVGSIREAKSVSIPDSTTIKITGDTCRTITLDGATGSIVQAVDSSASCTPPDSPLLPVTQDEVILSTLEFSPTGDLPEVVSIKIEGIYKDSLGEHPIDFATTVVPRVAL